MDTMLLTPKIGGKLFASIDVKLFLFLHESVQNFPSFHALQYIFLVFFVIIYNLFQFTFSKRNKNIFFKKFIKIYFKGS